MLEVLSVDSVRNLSWFGGWKWYLKLGIKSGKNFLGKSTAASQPPGRRVGVSRTFINNWRTRQSPVRQRSVRRNWYLP